MEVELAIQDHESPQTLHIFCFENVLKVLNQKQDAPRPCKRSTWSR